MKLFISLLLVTATLLFGDGFLMPEEAFQPSAKMQNNTVAIDIKLAEAIHLYKDTIKIELKNNDNLVIKDLTLPKDTTMKHNREVFTKDIHIIATLVEKQRSSKQENFSVKLKFQGCSDKGLCYEPISKTYDFSIAPKQLQTTSAAVTASTTTTAKTLTDTEAITSSFQNKSIFVVLLTFFGFGLLLSMTPCIFPMIPILSSIIVSQKEGMSAKKGFLLSLVYVLAMAGAYTIAGVLAGMFGQNLQAAMQNPYVIITFALIFVALAFSMFGFYEIGLPSSLQSKISQASDNASHKGGFIGVGIMGFLSALIVGPCVAPPLAGTLIYIGQTGDALFGGLALFVMSLGMGVPLLLIGIGTGKFMPRPGGWMNSVSKIFGVFMLAIAIWMLEKIAPPQVTMALWAILFVVASVYMGVLEPLGEKRSYNAFAKGLGAVSLIFGVSLFVGLLSGSTKMFAPFEKFTQQCSIERVKEDLLAFQSVESLEELEPLLAQNKGKKVVLDFAAQWCTSCKELDSITFKDPNVIKELSSYTLIRADLSDNNDQTKALAEKYGVFGPPAVLFLDEKANVIKEKTVIGYKDPTDFLVAIKG